MTKTRTWFTSRISRDTELYIETIRGQAADKMPRAEHRILAAVTPGSYKWLTDVWLDGVRADIKLPAQFSQEAAMEAVVKYFEKHEPHEQPELL